MIGTTPTHTFKLPFEVTRLKSISVVFVQNGEVIVKKKTEDCVLEGSQVLVSLSQADTLKFDEHSTVYLQMRVLTIHGKALKTKVFLLTPSQCLDKEELT